MSIDAFDIHRYKHFNGLSASELPTRGLILVEGPNEAGKSTLREALGWALFGVRGAARDAEVSIGLALAGRPRMVVRRVGGRVSVEIPGQRAGDAADLAAALPGLDLAVFRAVFSFDAFELQQIATLDTDAIRQRLAAAGLEGGTTRPSHEVVRRLREAEDGIFRPRAKCPLRDAEQQLEALDRSLKLSREAIRSLDGRRKELEKKEAEVAALKVRQRKLIAEATHLGRLRQARPLLDEVLEAEQALAALVQPALGSTALAPLLELAQRFEALSSELDVARDAEAKLEIELGRWQPDARIIEAAPRISTLQRESPRIQAIEERREQLVREHDNKRGAFERLRSAAPQDSQRDIARWFVAVSEHPRLAEADRPWPATNEALREANDAHEAARAHHAERAAEVTHQEAELQRLALRLDPSVEAAQANITRLIHERVREREARDQHQALEPQLSQLEERIAHLDSEDARAFPPLGASDLETIEVFRNRLVEGRTRSAERATELRRREAQAADSLERIRAELQTIGRQTPPPMTGDILAATERELVETAGRLQVLSANRESERRLLEEKRALLGGERPDSTRLDHATQAKVRQAEDAARAARAELARAEQELVLASGSGTSESVESLESRRMKLVSLRADFDRLAELHREGHGGAPLPLPTGVVALSALGFLAAMVVSVLAAAWLALTFITVTFILVAVVFFRVRAVATASQLEGDEPTRLREALSRRAGELGLGERPESGVLTARLDALNREVDAAKQRNERIAALGTLRDRCARLLAQANDEAAEQRRAAGLPPGVEVETWFGVAREAVRIEEGLAKIEGELAEVASRRESVLGRLMKAAELAPTRGEGRVSEALNRARAAEKDFRDLLERKQQLTGQLETLQATLDDCRRELAVPAAESAEKNLLAEWHAVCSGRGWPTLGEVPDDRWLGAARRARELQEHGRRRGELLAERSRLEAVKRDFAGELDRLAAELGESVGADLLERLDGRIKRAGEARAAWQAAERRLAEARQRCEASQVELARCQRDLARLEAEAERFREWRRAVGAPEALTADRVGAWVSEVREGRQLLIELSRLDAEIAAAQAEVSRWFEAARAIARALGHGEPERLVEAHVLIEQLEGLRVEALQAQSRRKEAQAELVAAADTRRRIEAPFTGLEATLRAELEAHGLGSLAALRVEAERVAAWEGATRTLEEADKRLARTLEGARREELTDDLGARLAEVEAERDEVERSLEDALRSRQTLEDGLRDLAESTDVTRLATERELADERRRALLSDWVRARLARALVEATVERLRRERQPEVLKRASQWFARATGGGYVAIENPELDKPLDLQLRDSAGNSHPVAVGTLSAGTLGLLYLCLRLGLALEHGGRTVMLPVLLDDVLAHLDPERAREAAKVISDVAHETQVWLFTCRPETAALLQEVHPAARILRLDRWTGRPTPVARLSGAPARARATNPTPRVPPVSSSAQATPSPDLIQDSIEILAARGPLSKAGLLEALGLEEKAWSSLRVVLESDPRVRVEGERRGRVYRFVGQSMLLPNLNPGPEDEA